MYKYFTENETRKWVANLDDFVKGYNNSYHSRIKITPAEVSKRENNEIVWWNVYGAYVTAECGVPKLKIGETVRIVKYKNILLKVICLHLPKNISKLKKF